MSGGFTTDFKDEPYQEPKIEKKQLTSSEFTILKGVIKNLGDKISQLEVQASQQQSKIQEKDALIKKYKAMALKPGRVP